MTRKVMPLLLAATLAVLACGGHTQTTELPPWSVPLGPLGVSAQREELVFDCATRQLRFRGKLRIEAEDVTVPVIGARLLTGSEVVATFDTLPVMVGRDPVEVVAVAASTSATTDACSRCGWSVRVELKVGAIPVQFPEGSVGSTVPEPLPCNE